MPFRTIEVIAVSILLLVVALTFHAWIVSHDEEQRLQSTLAAQKRAIDDANSREQVRDATLNNTLAEIDKLKKATQSSQQLVGQVQKYLALPQPIQLVNRGLSPSPHTTEHALVVDADSKSFKPQTVQMSTKGKSPSSAIPGLLRSTSRLGRDGILPPSPTVPESDSASENSLSIQSHTDPGTISSPATAGVPFDSPVLQQPQLPSPASSCDDRSRCAAEFPAADLKPLFNYVQDCRACDATLAVAKQNASDDAAKIAALTRERDAAITASKGGSLFRRLRRNLLWLSVGAALGFAASH